MPEASVHEHRDSCAREGDVGAKCSTRPRRLGPNSKAAARSGVSRVGKRLTSHAVTARTVEQVLQRMPKQLTARFAAMKSESVAPVLGSFTSASFNGGYLQAVTHTARIAYRERFLPAEVRQDLLSACGL